MSTLDRRSLFALAAAAAAHNTLPAWLAQALAIQEPVSTWRVKQLREAIARAKQANKPLLVFIAPAANDRNVRGNWFSAWMEWLRDEELYLLPSCEFACATVAEIGSVLGAKLEGTPFWALADVRTFDAEKKTARVTPIACEVPVLTTEVEMPHEREAGLAAMRAAFLDGAKRHGLELAPLAAAALRRLDAAQARAIDDWFTGGVAPDLATITAGAAEVWRRFGSSAERPEDKVKVLRKAVMTCVAANPIAGARWMTPGFCATPAAFVHPTKAEVAAERKELEAFEKALKELDPAKPYPEAFLARFGQHIIMCGRGRSSPLAERFLEFWTAGD